MALIYEKRGKIAYVTINRPEVMNAMDPETYSELSQAWIDIRDDPDVWCAIIAAVNGFCLAGGMTLLLATDLRVSVEHAKFGLSEVKRGILPGNGGTQRTIQQLPYPIAMWLLMSGEWLSAQEAQQYGLINKVVPQGELITEAERMANVICQNGPLAVRAIKELAVRGQYMPIEYGLRMEQAMGQMLRATDDAKEGPRAFAEKRKANFTGR